MKASDLVNILGYSGGHVKSLSLACMYVFLKQLIAMKNLQNEHSIFFKMAVTDGLVVRAGVSVT